MSPLCLHSIWIEEIKKTPTLRNISCQNAKNGKKIGSKRKREQHKMQRNYSNNLTLNSFCLCTLKNCLARPLICSGKLNKIMCKASKLKESVALHNSCRLKQRAENLLDDVKCWCLLSTETEALQSLYDAVPMWLWPHH